MFYFTPSRILDVEGEGSKFESKGWELRQLGAQTTSLISEKLKGNIGNVSDADFSIEISSLTHLLEFLAL